MDAAPIQGDEFSRLMAASGLTPAEGRVAVAVSGGGDSMALSLLAARWGKAVFLTFDHGLRPESAAEAAQTGRWLKKYQLEHHILTWEGTKPDKNLQAAARLARYRALEDWCAASNIRSLLLAHHQDDQAETFLLRLARGSGVDGLAAMRKVTGPLTRKDGPNLVRPLLDVPKARLAATLKLIGQDWIEDPSNENRDFDRIKIRDFLKDPPLEGFNPARLAATAKRLQRVRSTLESLTAEILTSAVTIHSEGYGAVSPEVLSRYGDEIGLRVLARLVVHIGGNAYPPRLKGLERIYDEIAGGGAFGAALAGCLIQREDKGPVMVMREVAAIEGPVMIRAGETVLWDRRFLLSRHTGCRLASCEAAALGGGGWNSFLSNTPDLAAKVKNIPHSVRLSLPAFQSGGRLVAIPHLGYEKTGAGSFSACFSPHMPLYTERPDWQK